MGKAMGLAEPSGEHQHKHQTLALSDHKLLIWRIETGILMPPAAPQNRGVPSTWAVAQQLEAGDAKQNTWIISLLFCFVLFLVAFHV